MTVHSRYNTYGILLEKGIPENEIAFIHNADTEVKKKDLFQVARSCSDTSRIYLKNGCRTNVQTLLYAVMT